MPAGILHSLALVKVMAGCSHNLVAVTVLVGVGIQDNLEDYTEYGYSLAWNSTTEVTYGYC